MKNDSSPVDAEDFQNLICVIREGFESITAALDDQRIEIRDSIDNLAQVISESG